jgi:hypothetical protein
MAHQARAVVRVPVVPSREDFVRDYMRPAEPVVLNIPPCEASNWTLQSLKEAAGATEVITRINTRAYDYKVWCSAALLFDDAHYFVLSVVVCLSCTQVGKAYKIARMTFGEYIDNLVADNAKSRDCYLAVQNLKISFPSLLVCYYRNEIFCKL